MVTTAIRWRYVHGITIRVQLQKLVFRVLGFPGRLAAGKWGSFSSMDVIVAEAMYGIFAISPL